MDWEVKNQHSYRETYFCADALTNISYSKGGKLMFSESCRTPVKVCLFSIK